MSAAVDFRAMVAATDHRDADLLDLIERFTKLRDTTWVLIRRAERLGEKHRAYRGLWREVLSSRDARNMLEKAICDTKAQTPLGAIAKAQCWIEQHEDNTGSMFDLPRAALADLMAMLGEAGA